MAAGVLGGVLVGVLEGVQGGVGAKKSRAVDVARD